MISAKVLLTHRTDNNESWALPGGAMDLGETIAQAGVRETREETGIEREIVRLVGIYTDPRHVILYTSNGEVRQECSVVFRRARNWRRTHSEHRVVGCPMGFADIDCYPVHPSMRQRVQHLLEHRREPYIG